MNATEDNRTSNKVWDDMHTFQEQTNTEETKRKTCNRKDEIKVETKGWGRWCTERRAAGKFRRNLKN
jgi:hypothetical protein